MPGWTATILLVAARIAALAIVVPGMQNRFVPWRLRLLLVALLTAVVICVIPPCSDGDVAIPDFCMMLAQEASIGLSLAMVPAALFLGLQLASGSLQGMTGLPAATGGPDMAGEGFSRLFFLVAVTVFFVCSGHRILVQALLDSFQWMPVGSVRALPTTKDICIDILTQSFQLGVRSLAPIAASLAIGILCLAAINRVIPQLSYFAIGMSVQTTIMLGCLLLFLGGIGLFLESGLETTTALWQSRWLALVQTQN